MFHVSASPAPSQPTGRLPETRSIVSSVIMIDSRSCSGAISVRRIALVWLWPSNSQPRRIISSITSGWCRHTSLFSAALPRMP